MRVLRVIDNETTTAANSGRSQGGKMRIAFASQDLKEVNSHFASCRNIAFYEVSAEDSRFLEAAQFSNVSNEEGEHQVDGDGGQNGEDRLTAKIHALEGTHILFVLAIGGPAAARVVRNKVHPIKLPQAETIESVIERVQGMLKGNPPPWMRKILEQDKAKANFDFMDEED